MTMEINLYYVDNVKVITKDYEGYVIYCCPDTYKNRSHKCARSHDK